MAFVSDMPKAIAVYQGVISREASTVIHSIRKVDDAMSTDDEFRRSVEGVRTEIEREFGGPRQRSVGEKRRREASVERRHGQI